MSGVREFGSSGARELGISGFRDFGSSGVRDVGISGSRDIYIYIYIYIYICIIKHSIVQKRLSYCINGPILYIIGIYNQASYCI